jgi:CBS domain containing-hemolysin-like protein
MQTSPAILAVNSISPLIPALAVIATVLSFNGALLAYAALAGRITRVLTRSDLGRIVGAIVLSVALTALLVYWISATQLAAAGYAAWGATALVVCSAIGLALLCPTVGALIGALHNVRSARIERLAHAAQILSEIFIWWLPRRRKANGNGHGGDEEPEFEITMASGEEVDAEEREYIENILEMGETTADEVMTPRTDVVALDVEWEPQHILELVAESRFSRFPVYEGNIDNVIGVLHLRDMLEFLARGEGVAGLELREMIMDPNFIPGSRKVDDALRDLQRKKGHMAIILDEYGGTAGIMTIEDLLEEIVGEIQDEYDDETKHYHQREDGSWVVSAQIRLDDLNELLLVSITENDVETLGGFIANELGRIPKARERVEHDGWRFTVLSVARNRIGRVLVERVTQP